jgi:phasin family protein
MDRITKQLKNPFAAITDLLERVNLAGFDASGIVEARRKDIEAIVEANRIVYDGAQALAHKQFEILRMTMTAARGAVTEGSFSGTPIEIASRQRELMGKAFQMSLKHMRDLADIVRKAQSDAFAVVKKQVQADIGQLTGRAPRKAKAAVKTVAKAPARKAPAVRKAKATAKAKPAARKAAAGTKKAAPSAKKAAPAAKAKGRSAKTTA